MTRTFPMILAAALLAGCGTDRREAPLTGETPAAMTNAAAGAGERVFMANCYQCHPGGRAGVGPALNNKPAPARLIEFQVRHGLGGMPAFGPDRIPQGQLHELSAYVVTLRKQGAS
jgi:mono/diheme cytochrome c family protein